MPKLIIDNRRIEVPEGTKVIEAAEQTGIMIPRFCFHPALGSVGACRVCAVKFLEGPVKGIEMSCMVDVTDGMVISSNDPEVVDFRKTIIELLMTNHPHDCPVCDEGGHCLLQDMTVAGGHCLRKYRGKKRTHQDQNLGHLIQHEMNRCIQCYRCVRMYREYFGYADLGVMGIGSRVYFGRMTNGGLKSPFSGNLVDICPTGVFTDKPSRFMGRHWDFQRSDSICIHCSLGCSVTTSARYREIIKQEALFDPFVNGWFICDRGRFGFGYANRYDRPRSALVHGKPIDITRAIQKARDNLFQIQLDFGPEAIACVGSTRNSLETLLSQKFVSRLKGWRSPAFFGYSVETEKTRAAVNKLRNRNRVSLKEIETADCVLVFGTDPVNEAPMLAPALRQAWRNGGKVYTIDPRPVTLPLEFYHEPVSIAGMSLFLESLMKKTLDRDRMKTIGIEAFQYYDALKDQADKSFFDVISVISETLKHSLRPVIVCGTDSVSGSLPNLCGDFAKLLTESGKNAGVFFIMEGADAFGAALVSDPGSSFEKLLSDIEEGKIKALVAVESDLYRLGPEKERIDQALNKLNILVTIDFLNTKVTKKADIFIPSANIFEAGGTFINQEGRIRKAMRVHQEGVSIREEGAGGHPPRIFRKEVPGSGIQTAATILTAIADEDENSGLRLNMLESWMHNTYPELTEISFTEYQPENTDSVATGNQSDELTFSALFSENDDPGTEQKLSFVPGFHVFGSEELSANATLSEKMEKTARIFIHETVAEKIGIADGDIVFVGSGAGSTEGQAEVRSDMDKDTVVVPIHREFGWWKPVSGSRIQLRKIR